MDYLLKPIPFERFLIAVDRAYERHQLKQDQLENSLSESIPTERSFLVISVEYQRIKVFFDEILYIEGMKDYVKIYVTTQSKPLLSRMNLKAIASKLPSTFFFRVHQSYIVAVSKITSFQKNKIYVGMMEIPLGLSTARNLCSDTVPNNAPLIEQERRLAGKLFEFRSLLFESNKFQGLIDSSLVFLNRKLKIRP